MTSTHPPSERPVLEKVENGLKQAVQNDPDMEWSEEGTKIRRQKYTDRAVEHFTRRDEDPVVTSSWYKYGKTYPAAPSGANVGDGQFPSLRIRDSELYTASVDEITRFFTHEVRRPTLNENNWYMGTLSFLKQFYNWHAPDEYRDLYLANIGLRRVFADTKHEISSLRDQQNGEKASLGDFGNNQSVNYYKRVGRAAAQLHMEIATTPSVEDTLSPVREFTDLVDDVFMVLAEHDQSDLTSYHHYAIESLEEFYSESAWEYVAAYIMRDTAEGPNSDWVEQQAEGKIKALNDSFNQHLEMERQLCGEAGLLPGVEEYPDQGDDVESAISGMMRTIDDMDE
jgi:hypothetical protein